MVPSMYDRMCSALLVTAPSSNAATPHLEATVGLGQSRVVYYIKYHSLYCGSSMDYILKILSRQLCFRMKSPRSFSLMPAAYDTWWRKEGPSAGRT